MIQWRAGTVVEQVRQLGRGRGVRRAPRRRPRRRRCARSAYTAVVGAPQPGDRVLLNTTALLSGPGHRRPGVRRRRARPPARPTRRAAARATSSRPATRPMQQMLLGGRRAGQPAPRRPRRRRRPRPGCRWSSPTCTPPCRRCWPASAAVHPQARVAYVMTDGGALPAGLLPHRGRAGGGRVARRDDHGRAGLRRRPRGRHVHTGLLAAPARRGGRRRRRGPGPGQPRHRHPVGLLRGRLRGEALQRRRRAGRPRRRVAARLGGRPRASGTAASPTTAARPTGGSLLEPGRRAGATAARRRCSTRWCATRLRRAGRRGAGRP